MAKVKIQGHASGTGVLTVTAPNTSTDRTITLPDSTGELLSTAGGTLTGGLSGTTAAFSSTITSNGQAQLNNNNLIGTNTGATSEWIGKRTSSGEGIHITTTNASGADTQRLAITCNADSADFIVKDSDIVFGTAGKGICLGVTSNTDANTLDDYEEGTWTPTTSSGWDSLTFTDTGSYTKIGNIVHVMVKVNVDGSGTGSGGTIMGGLPFASSSTGSYRSAISIFACRLASAVDTYVSGYIDSNSTTVVIREGGTTGDGGDLAPHFDSGSYFYFQATYRV